MTSPDTAAREKAPCPSCGALTAGKFCSECGASLGKSKCSACDVELIDGARFCHRCGLPAGASRPASERRPESAMSLPWVVAAIALLAFIALVAGQKFGASPANAPAPVADGSAGMLPAGRAPDISRMTPTQRASALFDRIMGYSERGVRDSLTMFAPMAIAAYEMLGDLDLDARYDLGRIGEVSGDTRLAKAQADTILRQSPNHLLGLILAARVARIDGRSNDERNFLQRLVAAEPAERAKRLDEYVTHENDIVAALDEARRTIRR